MRHRVIATACAAGTAVGAAAAVLLATAPADAAGSVHITEIYYNSPGSDTRSNTSINGEWVLIKNTTSKSASLKGWTLTDASRHTYTVPTFTLKAGKTVKIRTGKGGNTSATLYQGRAAYVWNNDKDTATLRKSTGSKADSCSYNSKKASYKKC